MYSYKEKDLMNGEHISLKRDPKVYQPAVQSNNGVSAYDMQTHIGYLTDAVKQEKQYASYVENSSNERTNRHLEVFTIGRELTIINDELQPFIDSLETCINYLEALNTELLESVEQEKPAVKTLLKMRTYAISTALNAILSESHLISLALQRADNERAELPGLNPVVKNQIEHWKVQMLSLKERFNAVTIAISQLPVSS